MDRSTRKALNELLARAMRANDLAPSGALWAQAKGVRDALIAEGVKGKSACNKAAFRVARGETTAHEILDVIEEPITQAPTRLSAQAKRVQEGAVMRDSRGRILPTHVQEAYAELAAL